MRGEEGEAMEVNEGGVCVCVHVFVCVCVSQRASREDEDGG